MRRRWLLRLAADPLEMAVLAAGLWQGRADGGEPSVEWLGAVRDDNGAIAVQVSLSFTPSAGGYMVYGSVMKPGGKILITPADESTPTAWTS